MGQLSSRSPTFSPLEPIFAAHSLEEIPQPFREQFLYSPAYPYVVVLEGVMHHIWYKPGWLKPLFWLLGKAKILVPQGGNNIPTRLEVIADFDPDGQPFHTWKRTFDFKKPYIFPTTIIYDPALNEVVDLVGPNNILYMVWKAKFHPPATFTLDTHSVALRLGARKVWLPQWLWPWLLGVVRFEQVAEEAKDNAIRVEITISHPLFGDFFGYHGTFHAVRHPKAA